MLTNLEPMRVQALPDLVVSISGQVQGVKEVTLYEEIVFKYNHSDSGLVLDLSKAAYLTSYGYGILIAIKNMYDSTMRSFSIFLGDNLDLRHTFMLLNFDKVFNLI